MNLSVDDEIRLKRLIARNNYTEEYAKTRMEAQQSQDEKIKKSEVNHVSSTACCAYFSI